MVIPSCPILKIVFDGGSSDMTVDTLVVERFADRNLEKTQECNLG